MTLLPEVRSQLLQAAERRSRGSAMRRRLSRSAGLHHRGPGLVERWRRGPLILLAVGFVLAGSAFAGGLISFGAPAKPTSLFSRPRSGLGALTPGTVRVLALSTPDPAGGSAWGLRVLSTTRGLGCLQVGRLVNGKLVAIGRDGAFADDGRAHELPASGDFFSLGCGALDGKGRLFLNVTYGEEPASAWFGGCNAPGSPPGGWTRSERMCPLGDERNLYYGLLGPYAKSITYTRDGQSHTQPTIGGEGAYLLVTKSAAKQLLTGTGTTDVVPVDGPITEIHYRNGSTCHLTARSWIGGRDACTPELQVPVGYARPRMKLYTRAQVVAPVSIRSIRTREGQRLSVISFVSRVALPNARSRYQAQWREDGKPRDIYGFSSTDTDIEAGERVNIPFVQRGDRRRPRVFHGTVSLVQSSEAFEYERPAVLVAHFSARMR
jgi:hypothetical protein